MPETVVRTPLVNVALADISPLDVGSVVNDLRAPQSGDGPTDELDEGEDVYWREVDDLPLI
jgi:hypothetical protein